MLAPSVEHDIPNAPSLGHDIDYLHKVREQKRALEEELNKLSAHYTELEQKLIERMQLAGVSKATGKKATVSVQRKTRPQVVDWDEFNRFVRRNNLFHLFERRVAVAAWNELCEKRGRPVPGTVPFVKDTLSLRTTDK